MNQENYKRLKSFIEQQHNEGKTVAITKGVFDLIHPSHIEFLNKIKDLADILVVLVISDRITGKLKPGRPIQDQDSRIKVLEALKSVDYSDVDYDSIDPKTDEYSKEQDIKLLRELNPDFWIVSLGRAEKFKDFDLGNIKIIELEEGKGHSTTKIVNKILNNYKDIKA